MSPFSAFDAVVDVARHVADGLTVLLTPFAGDLAGAVAIVAGTVAVRLLLSPLSYLQFRAARRAAALTPRLAELRARYRDDPVRLAAETLAARRAAGVSAVPGLLPALLRAPFLMVMYRLVVVPAGGAAPALLSGTVFGAPMAAHLLSGPAAVVPVFVVLLVLATVTAWCTSRLLRRLGTAPARLSTLTPYASVIMVAVLPLAGALYVVTTTAWSLLEQALCAKSTRLTDLQT
jgi:YidC/Oxa1 family membrane protein insertase